MLSVLAGPFTVVCWAWPPFMLPRLARCWRRTCTDCAQHLGKGCICRQGMAGNAGTSGPAGTDKQDEVDKCVPLLRALQL